jgi:hypothetical protein
MAVTCSLARPRGALIQMVDVLRPLKEADSLNRRLTSQTENVLGGIDIPMM